MSIETGPVTRRELGGRERIFNALQGVASLIACQTLHVVGNVEADALRAGLQRMQRRFPLLSAHLEHKGTGFLARPPFIYRKAYFDLEGTGPIPLRVIEDAGPDDWRATLKEELATPFRADRNPRIRVNLLRHSGGERCEIQIVKDHTVADLPAGFRLVGDIMRFLGGTLPDGDPPLSLPPALEERFTSKQDGGKRAYQPALRLPLPGRRKGPRGTSFWEHRLSEPETAAVNEAVRRRGMSVHAAIAAAVLTAMRETYRVDKMTVATNVELRRLCKPAVPVETFGCYVDILRTAHRLDQPFWDLARDVKAALIAAIVNNQEGASLLRVPEIGVYWAERKTLTSGMRIDGLSVTSAGTMPLVHEYGPFTLEDVTSVVSVGFIGPYLFVVDSEWDGRLSLTAIYAEPILDPDEVDRLMVRATALLIDASRDRDRSQVDTTKRPAR